jgi:hypothetical protein
MEKYRWRHDKAPLAQEAVGRNPTDRGKNGSKHHILVDERGVPLSIVVTVVNRHDVSRLELVLDEIIIDRPDTEQNICADLGNSGELVQQAIKDRNYIPHVKQRREEIRKKKTTPHTELAGGWLKSHTPGSTGSENFW